MDDVEFNLIQAWARVWKRCVADPGEAGRRWRMQGATFSRPPRDWCLTIRASDPRLEAMGAIVEDEGVAWENEHEVKLDGGTIGRLCAPVKVDWPGIPLSEAAEILGRHTEALRHWLPVRPGRTRAERAAKQPRRWETINDASFPLVVKYVHPGSRGHWGYDVPVVWTRGWLNPGANRGTVQHAMWASAWGELHKKVREDYGLIVRRAPRFRPRLGWDKFAGWDWICPGLPSSPAEGAEVRPCGRRVHVLYGPLPVMTLGRLLEEKRELAIDSSGWVKKLAGKWRPGWHDPWAWKRTFACAHCWRVRNLSMADYRGWNDFVTYISGGLLYGHEVKRPAWVRYERKRAVAAR